MEGREGQGGMARGGRGAEGVVTLRGRGCEGGHVVRPQSAFVRVCGWK